MSGIEEEKPDLELTVKELGNKVAELQARLDAKNQECRIYTEQATYFQGLFNSYKERFDLELASMALRLEEILVQKAASDQKIDELTGQVFTA